VEPVLCTAGESLRTGVGLKTRKLAAATIHHASTAPPRCLVFDPTPTRAEGQAKQLNEILEPNAERTEAPSRDDRAATPRVERNLARARFPPPPLFRLSKPFSPSSSRFLDGVVSASSGEGGFDQVRPFEGWPAGRRVLRGL